MYTFTVTVKFLLSIQILEKWFTVVLSGVFWFPLGSISSVGGKYCALWHAVIIIDFPSLEFIEMEILNKNGHTWAYLWPCKMTLLYRNDIWLLWPCSSVTSSKNRNVYISRTERDFDTRFFFVRHYFRILS